MNTIHWVTPKPIYRRLFLRATGVGLALPWLEAMRSASAATNAQTAPRRMVLINKALGLYAPDFFPEKPGRDFQLSPYLQEFADLRHDFTVFSGVSHPDVGGGHGSEASYLTSAPHPGTPAFRNTISLDQFVAEKIAGQTRYPFLCFASHSGSLSWTRNGVQIPPDKDPALVFRRLFVVGTPEEVRQQERQLKQGQSILDSVASETASLRRRVGAGDRERLDQYFSAVRDVEQRLNNAQAWSKQPKPKVDVPPPGSYPDSSDIVGRMSMMLDLAHLALQTDSTRVITFAIDVDGGAPPIPGVEDSRHNLSHHGQDPEKIRQLRRVELAELQSLTAFLTKLKATNDRESDLLSRTMVLYGSNLGNASSHETRNLPAILFGGGFKHGQYLAFDQHDNLPLANLFLSMAQRYGIECDRFGSSSGTIRGLEFA